MMPASKARSNETQNKGQLEPTERKNLEKYT